MKLDKLPLYSAHPPDILFLHNYKGRTKSDKTTETNLVL